MGRLTRYAVGIPPQPLDPQTILILHAAATWFMVGVIWLIQVVHYPMLELLDRNHFQRSHTFHSNAITPVVMPAMLIELALAGLISWLHPWSFATLSGLAMVLSIWLVTFFAIVPLHTQFQRDGFSEATHVALCRWNWMRTIAWSLRGVLACWLVIHSSGR